MNQNILILCLLFVLLNCKSDYILSLDMLISGSSKYDIELVNRKDGVSDNDLFYFGNVEYMENILIDSYTKEGKAETIKNEKHRLVFMFDKCLFEYINFFPPDTIFVVGQECIKYNQEYSDYTIFKIYQGSTYYINMVEREHFYFAKLGRDIEPEGRIFFYIIIGMTTVAGIFLCFIFKRVLRNMDETNILLINFLICHLSDLLMMSNVGNILSFFFFMEKQSLDFLSEYILVFLISLYKGAFYTCAIVLLKGWMTSNFDPLGDSFKKYYKRLILYELLVSLVLHVSVYFINFMSKLNLFYLKEELEQVAFIAYFIYCIIKRMVPLYKQMKYEQSLRSDLVECLKFKYKRLFNIYLLLGIHALWIMISPLIEKLLIYKYIYNYHLHYIFVIFYEANFCIGLNIIFIPKTLPNNFYEEIIYNYKGMVYLIADIYEGDDEENHNKKLNISNMTFNDLKKASKKENYPILLINPFASSRDQLLFDHIHIGIPQRYQKSND